MGSITKRTVLAKSLLSLFVTFKGLTPPAYVPSCQVLGVLMRESYRTRRGDGHRAYRYGVWTLYLNDLVPMTTPKANYIENLKPF